MNILFAFDIIFVAIVIGNSFLILVFLISIACVYDRAGKSFNELKLFERQYRRHPSKSNESARNLIHRYNKLQ